MTTKVKIVTAFSICTVVITAPGAVAGFAARADDLGAAIYNGVNQLRQTCGVIGDDPRLTVAAQRHANDMLMNGIGGGHIGSDGSSPQARIADAGYTRAGYTSEIVYWGTGSMRLRAQRSTYGWKVLYTERSSWTAHSPQPASQSPGTATR